MLLVAGGCLGPGCFSSALDTASNETALMVDCVGLDCGGVSRDRNSEGTDGEKGHGPDNIGHTHVEY